LGAKIPPDEVYKKRIVEVVRRYAKIDLDERKVTFYRYAKQERSLFDDYPLACAKVGDRSINVEVPLIEGVVGDECLAFLILHEYAHISKGRRLGEDKASAKAAEWLIKAGVIPLEKVEQMRSQAESANNNEALSDEIERVLARRNLLNMQAEILAAAPNNLTPERLDSYFRQAWTDRGIDYGEIEDQASINLLCGRSQPDSGLRHSLYSP
jgi:hypothetical protein